MTVAVWLLRWRARGRAPTTFKSARTSDAPERLSAARPERGFKTADECLTNNGGFPAFEHSSGGRKRAARVRRPMGCHDAVARCFRSSVRTRGQMRCAWTAHCTRMGSPPNTSGGRRAQQRHPRHRLRGRRLHQRHRGSGRDQSLDAPARVLRLARWLRCGRAAQRSSRGSARLDQGRAATGTREHRAARAPRPAMSGTSAGGCGELAGNCRRRGPVGRVRDRDHCQRAMDRPPYMDAGA